VKKIPLPLPHLLLLALFAYLMFFFRLGGIGLVGPDEPRYAQIAREMLASGDFVTPRLLGAPWFEKPVLFYWFTALFYQLFGIHEYAARLLSALAGCFGLYCAYRLGSRLLSPRGGLYAGLILACSPLYFSLARAASMDMLLTATLTGAWTFLYFWLFPSLPPGGGFPRPLLLLGFYGMLGCSVLAKGPVGILLVGGMLAIFLVITRRWRLLSALHLPWGFLVVLGVTLPWYYLCYQANGYLFIQEFLVRHNLERFITDRYQHLQPFWFFLVVILAGFFPWSLHLASSFRKCLAHAFRGSVGEEGEKTLYLWLWVLVPFLFFSFSRSKLPGYILPVSPALALLAASEFTRAAAHNTASESRGFFQAAYFQAGFLIILGIALPLAAPYLNLNLRPDTPLLAPVLVLTGIAGFLSARKRKPVGLLRAFLAGALVLVLLLGWRVLPRLDRSESQRQLAGLLRQQGLAHYPIYLWEVSRRVEYGLDYYLNAKTRLVYSLKDLEKARERKVVLIFPARRGKVPPLSRFREESRIVFQEQAIVTMAGGEAEPGPGSADSS
jgi:4-amino-4-deoxy-L-arabinose transferase-like glycosyltransferase